jgi:FkbM family methyltransferase
MTEPIVNLTRHYERFWAKYEAGKWEPETKALLEEVLSPGDLFVDIGAWIGPVSLWAIDCGATVVAVEPDPLALPELRRQLPMSTEIWEGALGLRRGTARLAGAGRGRRSFGTSMSQVSEHGQLRVSMWTLDEILAGRRPALVKIDIEGYELEVLPEVAPRLGAIGVPLQVSLHGVFPNREWFSNYGEVDFPISPRGNVLATP